MVIKQNRQVRRRERENADFLSITFFLLFLLKIGHLRENRMEAPERLPSFLTLFFCNASVITKNTFDRRQSHAQRQTPQHLP